MIGCWYTSLAAFDPDITYVFGKSQLVADPLSRLFQELRSGTYAQESNSSAGPTGMETPQAILSALAHVGRMPRCSTQGSVSKMELYPTCTASFISSCPGNLSLIPQAKKLVEQLTAPSAARSIPRAVWASHQKNDPGHHRVFDVQVIDKAQ